MEIEPAARRLLLNHPAVRGYVQDAIYTHALKTHVDQTGKRALVVRSSGGWAQPERVHTDEFPVLYVDCWADCTRDAAGKRRADDAISNAKALYRVVNPLLHARRGQRWGAYGAHAGLMVVSCVRWSEPVVQTRDMSQGGMAYGVTLGDTAVVTASYALDLAHETTTVGV